jgi:hypothetical protein
MSLKSHLLHGPTKISRFVGEGSEEAPNKVQSLQFYKFSDATAN